MNDNLLNSTRRTDEFTMLCILSDIDPYNAPDNPQFILPELPDDVPHIDWRPPATSGKLFGAMKPKADRCPKYPNDKPNCWPCCGYQVDRVRWFDILEVIQWAIHKELDIPPVVRQFAQKNTKQADGAAMELIASGLRTDANNHKRAGELLADCKEKKLSKDKTKARFKNKGLVQPGKLDKRNQKIWLEVEHHWALGKPLFCNDDNYEYETAVQVVARKYHMSPENIKRICDRERESKPLGMAEAPCVIYCEEIMMVQALRKIKH